MTTIRVDRRTNWAVVDKRTANDARLSFKARGILLWLLDKPDDWETSAERIEKQGAEGREAIRSGLKELEQYGYLTRQQWKDRDGKFQTEWTISEAGNAGSPYTGSRKRKAVDGNPSSQIKTEPTTEYRDQQSGARLKVQPDGCGKCDKGRIFLENQNNTVAPCECGVYNI